MNDKQKSSIKALLSNACSICDTYDEFAKKISSQVLEFKTQTQSFLNTLNESIQIHQSIQTEPLATFNTSTNTDQVATTSTSINTDAPSTNNASTITEAQPIQNETFRDDDDEQIRLYLTSISDDIEKASTTLPNALNTVVDSICSLPLHKITNDKNDSIIDTMDVEESPEVLNESTTANNTEMYITAINATTLTTTTPKPKLISNSDTINQNSNNNSANDTMNDAEKAIDDDLNDSNKENINENENAKSSFNAIESNINDDRLIIPDTQIDNNTEEAIENEVDSNINNNNDDEMGENLLVIDESRIIQDSQINGEKRSEKDDDEVSVPETVNSCSTNGGGTRRSTRQRVKQEPTVVDMGRRRTRTAVKLEKINETQKKSIDELMSSMIPCLVRIRKLSSDEISEYVNAYKAQNSVKSEPEEKDIDYEKMLASIDDINNEKNVNKSKKNVDSKQIKKKKAKKNEMDDDNDDELITDDEDNNGNGNETILIDEPIITDDVVLNLNSESEGEYLDEDDDENLISKERRKKILKATQKNENNRSCIDDDDDSDGVDDFMREFRMPHLEKEKADNSDNDNDEEVIKKASKKPKKRQRIDSASTDSSIASSNKRKTSQDKSGDESDEDTKGSDSDSQLPSISLVKKKKSKSALDDSDEDDDWVKIKREKKCNSDEENDVNSSSQRKDGRRNIRRMIDDRKLTQETKAALEEERERQERLRAQRQLKEAIVIPLSSDSDSEVLNGTLVGSAAGDKSFEALESPFKEARKPLYLDVDTKSKRALIEVHRSVVKHLKPHQVDGIKFMYESCYESVEAVASGKAASGCILAHCMGLGKTLQVVALVHTLMTNQELTKTKRVIVFSPVNTLFNWKKEFDTWLAGTERTYGIYGVSNSSEKFTRNDRKVALATWFEHGGVFLIGYNMFKIMLGVNKKNGDKVDEDMEKYLLNPGADLVICDEGHYLKNAASKISNTINRIATKRRIVLTGTPLQNNLVEYHCMVSFVKPKLLGTLKEFRNRFANPIENGQHLDSTTTDVAIMKKRAHVLHNLLDGCVQRKDYNVIKPLLPPKTEYVVYLKLSDVQKALISSYLKRTGTESIIRTNKIKGTRLFADFNFMMLVLAHPSLLHRKAEIDAKAKRKYDDKAEIDNVAVAGKSDENNGMVAKGEQDDVESNSNDNADDVVLPELNERWWKDIIGEGVDEQQVKLRVEMSAKLIVFEQILAKCMQIGDKMLVFSQSLLTLDLIESYLDELHKKDKKQKWICNQDYCRIDGEIDAKKRMRVIESFNKASNKRLRLFLLSSRSGGIGINLVAANRIVIFDPTWNPSHDCQSVFRAYRFGQKKPVFIYRLLALGTMEEKVYQRQVNKLSISQRVVDEHQLDRHYKYSELRDLYKFEPWDDSKIKEIPNVPADTLLADLLRSHGEWIVKYHEHDSLLENKLDEGLTDEEKKVAWEDYENERNPKRNLMVNENPLISDAPMDMMGMGMGYQHNLEQLNMLAAQIQFNQRYPAANGGAVGVASGSNVRPMMQQNNRGAPFYASTPRTTLNGANLPSFNPTPRLAAAGVGLATSAHANNMPNFNQYSSSSNNNQFAANQPTAQNVLRYVGHPNMQAPQDVLRNALLQRPQLNNNTFNSNNISNGTNNANENNFNK